MSFETLNQPWPWSLSFLWLWMRHLFICDVFLLFPLCSSVLEPDLHLRDKPSDQRDKPSSQLRKSAVQQSFDDLLSSPIFTFRLVVSIVTSPFISIERCFRPYKPYIFWKLFIWWWQWPRRILTKRQIQRQRHTYTDKDKYKVLPRHKVCYIYQKQGVEGFKI